MPKCRDVINRALRKIGELGVGEVASTQDAQMGLDALQSMFDGWATGGTFGPLRDVYKSGDYTASAGERVRTTATVTLPAYDTEGPTSDDDYGFYACDDGQPRNRALIVVVNPTTGARQTNLWDAWRGQWVRIEALTLSTECPLSALGVDDLACCLAKSIADETGASVSAQTEARAMKFMQRLTGKRDGSRQATRAEYL